MLIKLRKLMTNQKGFTLIELLVVISIIGVLAAIAVPRFTDATARANTAKIAADLRTIDSAIGMNQAIQGVAPADIATLVTNGHLAARPTVPTGNIFVTTVTAAGVTTTATTATPIGEAVYAITGLRGTFGGLTAESFK